MTTKISTAIIGALFLCAAPAFAQDTTAGNDQVASGDHMTRATIWPAVTWPTAR